MSRSGKFIPGASRRNRPKSDSKTDGDGAKSEPIRAGDPPDDGKKGFGRRMFGRGGSSRGGRGRDQRKPGQLLLVAGVAFLLIIGLGYYFFVLPERQAHDRLLQKMRQEHKEQIAAMQKQQEESLAQMQQKMAEVAADKAKGTLIVSALPADAEIKFAGEIYAPPVKIREIVPGEYIIRIAKAGYEPRELEVTFKGEEVIDKGTIQLKRQKGNLVVNSEQENVAYTMSGPEDFDGAASGYLPLKLSDIPVGSYQIVLTHKNWEVPYRLEVKPGSVTEKKVKFGYGNVVLETDPPGAEVNEGMRKLGTTPLTVEELRPGKRTFGLSKFGYKFKTVEVDVKAHEENLQKVSLEKNNDLRTSFGLELVWVPSLNLYAGRHEVSQDEYQKVMGTNPSTNRGGNRPVETVLYEDAVEFCKKATARERSRGTIPSGFRFELPTESEWARLMADSTIDDSFTSHDVSRDGSAKIGTSAPNELGLYDVVGNVNEWTSTVWRGNEDFRTIRGGNWLSSQSNFPDRSKAFGGRVDRARDKFTGFRVVLKK
ncbi:MAG: SUMF1/EgtB/PvdO family nonheme iron enzyme [Verrucomicrobiota bacterium]